MRRYRPSLTSLIRKWTRRVLHLRIPYERARAEPPRFAPGTVRWLLFSRWVPVHAAIMPGQGGWPPGVKNGDVVHYALESWAGAFRVTFPRVTRRWNRMTNVKAGCGRCTRRRYAIRPHLMDISCPKHGIFTPEDRVRLAADEVELDAVPPPR
jgi:hypothetical protein